MHADDTSNEFRLVRERDVSRRDDCETTSGGWTARERACFACGDLGLTGLLIIAQQHVNIA
jgi:hypothetical protein